MSNNNTPSRTSSVFNLRNAKRLKNLNKHRIFIQTNIAFLCKGTRTAFTVYSRVQFKLAFLQTNKPVHINDKCFLSWNHKSNSVEYTIRARNGRCIWALRTSIDFLPGLCRKKKRKRKLDHLSAPVTHFEGFVRKSKSCSFL